MTRQEVYRDIQETLGIIPTMFKALPDEALELEWGMFKGTQLNDEVIPQKYRELIGLAVGATAGDLACVAAHRELARSCGATENEMEAALRLAKNVVGWSVYAAGLGLDQATIREEVGRVSGFVRSRRSANLHGTMSEVAH